MKKSLFVVALLILTAGVSYAGDSFSIVIGPGGFGFQFGAAFGPWLPPPPPPPRFFTGWWPLPFWGRPTYWRNPPHGGYRYYRQRLKAPHGRYLRPGGGKPWRGGMGHKRFRHRR